MGKTEQISELDRAMQALEAQRAVLGDAVVEAGLEALREKRARLNASDDPLSLDDQLSALEGGGLIRLAQIEPELEYLFRHALVQDAAYTSILRQDRLALHGMVATTLERAYPERLTELAPYLMRHYREAGNTEQALHYATLATDAALSQYANPEAEFYAREALALTTDDHQRVVMLDKLGRALARLGRFDEAIEVWHSAIPLYLEQGDTSSAAMLYTRCARAAWEKQEHPKTMSIVREGLAALDQAPESEGLAFLLAEAGRAAHFNGLSDESLAYCQQAREMAVKVGAVEAEAEALITWGLQRQLPMQERIEALERGIEIAEAGGMLRTAHRAHNNLGVAYLRDLGDLRKTRYHAGRAAELAQQRGSLSEVVWMSSNLMSTMLGIGDLPAALDVLANLRTQLITLGLSPSGDYRVIWAEAACHAFMGEWDAAEKKFIAAIETADQTGNMQHIARNYSELGMMRLEQGRNAEAVSLLDQAITLAEGVALGVNLYLLRGMRLVALARLGQVDEAHRLLEQMKGSSSAQMRSHQIAIVQAEARLAVLRQEWDTALSSFEHTSKLQEQGGWRWRRGQTLREWAEAAVQAGHIDQAYTLLHKAHTEFSEMGTPIYAAKVEARLKEIEGDR